MMTREDIMRELELLPVWQMRAPLPAQTQASLQVQKTKAEPVKLNTTVLIAETIMEVTVEQDLVETASIAELEVTMESTSTSQKLTYIASDDGDWLFLLPSLAMTIEEQQLFQNICKAMRIRTKPAEIFSNILTLIDKIHPKIVLVMGEATVQMLLHSAEPLEALRGIPLQFQGAKLIATYDFASLLQNPPEKAKVWNDLCMGMQILQDLKVASSKRA